MPSLVIAVRGTGSDIVLPLEQLRLHEVIDFACLLAGRDLRSPAAVFFLERLAALRSRRRRWLGSTPAHRLALQADRALRRFAGETGIYKRFTVWRDWRCELWRTPELLRPFLDAPAQYFAAVP